MSVVSLARCADYERSAVEAGVEAALAPFGGLAGVDGFGRRIQRGSKVLVKPNFLKAAPPEACVSPHPEVVRAVCRGLLELGADVTIGDSPAFGSARGVAEANGIAAVADELGIPLIGFSRPVHVNTGNPLRLRLQLAREAVKADAVVNLCKLKGHQQLGMTVAVKNLFGCIVGKRKPAWHMRLGDRDNRFGEMLVEVYRHVAPVISLCDAVVAMEGEGPGDGDPRPVGLLMAAADAAALDAVAHELVGYPHPLRVLQAARTLGVGTPDLAKIELAGDASLDDYRIADWKLATDVPIFFNPVRVGWSATKQAYFLAKQVVRG